MQNENFFSEKEIKKYSKWLTKAAKYGVPLEDLVNETRRYHGNKFAEQIISRLTI